jgi:hypothetical protein
MFHHLSISMCVPYYVGPLGTAVSQLSMKTYNFYNGWSFVKALDSTELSKLDAKYLLCFQNIAGTE